MTRDINELPVQSHIRYDMERLGFNRMLTILMQEGVRLVRLQVEDEYGLKAADEVARAEREGLRWAAGDLKDAGVDAEKPAEPPPLPDARAVAEGLRHYYHVRHALSSLAATDFHARAAIHHLHHVDKFRFLPLLSTYYPVQPEPIPLPAPQARDDAPHAYVISTPFEKVTLKVEPSTVRLIELIHTDVELAEWAAPYLDPKRRWRLIGRVPQIYNGREVEVSSVRVHSPTEITLVVKFDARTYTLYASDLEEIAPPSSPPPEQVNAE